MDRCARLKRNVLIQVALTLVITIRLRLKLLKRLPMSVLFECRLTTNVKQPLSVTGAGVLNKLLRVVGFCDKNYEKWTDVIVHNWNPVAAQLNVLTSSEESTILHLTSAQPHSHIPLYVMLLFVLSCNSQGLPIRSGSYGNEQQDKGEQRYNFWYVCLFSEGQETQHSGKATHISCRGYCAADGVEGK